MASNLAVRSSTKRASCSRRGLSQGREDERGGGKFLLIEVALHGLRTFEVDGGRVRIFPAVRLSVEDVRDISPMKVRIIALSFCTSLVDGKGGGFQFGRNASSSTSESTPVSSSNFLTRRTWLFGARAMSETEVATAAFLQSFHVVA
eukprot:CAMPEP_0202826968 /NCGR_PEP_ID=MMETSP1389-20130828/13961_1 /ASSEMBLY_ACC=CAM_ASM_000865 /TAXON_ID=302021 /ORGANISM="Rhodomonas sp., Strain CCMP768" /LENGTH=146 /DNA_ID=CAMNT_0049500321 /DNA_START=145 /DNA_END=585 /DNA_ORIENTATION=-